MLIDWWFVLDSERLHHVYRDGLFALAYSSDKAVITRVDEEGCGAVMCAARYTQDA